MRRERQLRTERAPEDSPAPSPRRACRDEEGEPTGNEKGSRSPPQESNSCLPSPRMNRGDRSELVCTERASRGSSTPPAGQKSSGRRGRTSGSNTKATRDPPPPHPALLKEGREKKGKPRGARLPKKSPHEERTSVQGKKEPEGQKIVCKSFPLLRRPILTYVTNKF